MTILRRRAVCERAGLSYSSIRRLELAGDFPVRRQLGPNSVGWIASEVDDWLRARQAAQSKKFINNKVRRAS